MAVCTRYQRPMTLSDNSGSLVSGLVLDPSRPLEVNDRVPFRLEFNSRRRFADTGGRLFCIQRFPWRVRSPTGGRALPRGHDRLKFGRNVVFDTD